MKQFDLTRDTLECLMQKMNEDFNNGLSRDPRGPIKMLPTFVRSTPDGTEDGDFFALDLGGTNFRVLSVRIHNQEVRMSNKTYPISQALMTGTAEDLFGYIAECLAVFAKEQLGEKLTKISSIGFTFSFPVNQTSLVSGKLIDWTKGYDVSGVVGQDIVQLLHTAIKKRNVSTVDHRQFIEVYIREM